MPILTPLRRGLLYFCLHVVTQVSVLALSKQLMTHYEFGEVLFLRLLPAWLFVVGYVLYKKGFRPWQSARWRGHLQRGFFGFMNMILLYLSVKLLPFALAMTIRQLEAFVWVGLAAYFYHEKVSRRQWAALVIGFVGVLLVLRPSVEANILGTAIALGCALSGAYVRVLSRELSRTENSTTIIFFNFTQWTILTGCMAPWTWALPADSDWLPLLLSGLVILLSQWFMTEGMALAPAPRLAPFRHTEIFWAGLIGWLVWQEPISVWFVAGSVLIVIGGIMANWHVRRVKPVHPVKSLGDSF
jgi:drug/metabolite transporter (DMT)-like permease